MNPTNVNMICPICDRKIENDSGPRVDVSKKMKLPKTHRRYAHKICLEVKSTP